MKKRSPLNPFSRPPFGDWEVPSVAVERLVRRLEVKGNGVVEPRLNAAARELVTQLIPAWGADDIEMEDVISVWRCDRDPQVVPGKFCRIVRRMADPRAVPGVKVPELHSEHSPLNALHAGVVPNLGVVVPPRLTVIA